MAEETMIANGVHYKEILQLYNDLMALDSWHAQYYKDEHSVALIHKVHILFRESLKLTFCS